jgi:spoIIIJ-associated protein
MAEFQWTPEGAKPKIDAFLKPVLAAAGLDLDYRVQESHLDSELISPDIIVDFEGEDEDLLLTQRAELLLALEQLTLEALHVRHEDRFRLLFDVSDYRVLRIEELRLSAEAAAAKVKSTGAPFHFNPMTSRERRILHLALRDDESVTTTSEGMAPRRHTVIHLAAAKSARRSPGR